MRYLNWTDVKSGSNEMQSSIEVEPGDPIAEKRWQVRRTKMHQIEINSFEIDGAAATQLAHQEK